eukprot:SAG31_NODE_9947_length_1206_cov_2.692864_2_plen_274_part_00
MLGDVGALLAGEWFGRFDEEMATKGRRAEKQLNEYLRTNVDDPEALLLLARALRTTKSKAKQCEDTLDKLKDMLDGDSPLVKALPDDKLQQLKVASLLESAHLYYEHQMYRSADGSTSVEMGGLGVVCSLLRVGSTLTRGVFPSTANLTSGAAVPTAASGSSGSPHGDVCCDLLRGSFNSKANLDASNAPFSDQTACLSCGLQSASECGILDSTGQLVTTKISFHCETAHKPDVPQWTRTPIETESAHDDFLDSTDSLFEPRRLQQPALQKRG